MLNDTIQSLVIDVFQRVSWEEELDTQGYARPSLKDVPPPSQSKIMQGTSIATSSVVRVSHGGASASSPAPAVQGSRSKSAVTPAPSAKLREFAAPLQPGARVEKSRVIEQSRAHALSELKFRLEACTACGLSRNRTRIVFSDGTMSAPIAFVGDGPSREEDLVSLPFVGERGHLLNKIILAIGQRRENTYLCNVLKCAPAQGSAPTMDEVGMCGKFLVEQLTLVSPKVIVAMGQTAASFLLGISDDLAILRGRFHQWQNIPVMPTWSLENMLTTPALKREVWTDMKQVKALLEM